MTYKKYKIKKIEVYPNYIKFELNGDIEFNNGKQNFVFCINDYPFKNYQIGDEIEVNLTSAKSMNTDNYHQEIVTKTTRNNPWEHDNSNLQQDEEEKNKLLTQDLINLSAHRKIVIHRIFRNTLEWGEKYIELVYPNYQIKKQIHDNKIKRQDANDPNEIEKLFVGALSGFNSMLKMEGEPPKYFCDEIKSEYYKWLEAAGIDVNNCPSRLKHFLFEINEILEGRGDKIEEELENRDKSGEVNPNSPEYGEIMNKLFANIQAPLESARSEFSSLEGKTDRDIKIGNNFNSSGEKAEQAFKQMAGNHDYQGFNFFPQKVQQQNDMDIDRDSLRHEVPINQQFTSPDDKHSNSLGKTPIIITVIIGSVALLGLITYKVRKNNKQNN